MTLREPLKSYNALNEELNALQPQPNYNTMECGSSPFNLVE